MKDTISIGQASKLLNVSIDTIRYYEKIGLIPPIERRESGYRLLGVTDLLHLKGVTYLRDCGLSLDTIKDLSQDASKKESLVQEAIDLLEEKIKALEKSKDFLKEAQLEICEFEKGTTNYAYESLEGYFSPMVDEDMTLKTYLESDKMAWFIPIGQKHVQVITGQISDQKMEEGFDLKGLNFICINFEFDDRKKIEAEIYKMIHYAQTQGLMICEKILLMVYAKTSCFSGKALAGKLLLEIKKEHNHD